MYVLATAGDDRLADRVAACLEREGRVGVVRDASPDAPDRTTFDVGADGWRAAGPGGSIEDALDRLAPDHDYAVVDGFPDADLPRAVVGEARDRFDDPLYAAPSASAVDGAALREAVHGTEPRESLASLVAAVERDADEAYAGAVATFTGRVRAKDGPEDAPTESLHFERYDEVAERRLADLRADLEARDGVCAVRTHHRTGRVEAGEHIVHVVVLAGHRGEAFDAARDGIDRLKEEVPIFKKEVTVEEDFWVHERDRA